MNLNISSPALKCIVTNALLFAPTKGPLAVVRFRDEPGLLRAVATDGYVLSVEGTPTDSIAGPLELSLAADDAKALLKMLPKDEQQMRILVRHDDPHHIQFSTAGSSATYTTAAQEFPPWTTWLTNARANAGPGTGMGLAPQFLAKIGRADPYGGMGKPADWAGVATVELQCTKSGGASLWTYGEYLHGLVKPLTNVTLNGDELAAATSKRKKAGVPKCPVCKTADLTFGRERCQSCSAVAITEQGERA